MFKVGELISRYNNIGTSKGHCVVVDKDRDNYTLYNNSLKCLQRVACVVVDRIYKRIHSNTDIDEEGSVFEMT